MQPITQVAVSLAIGIAASSCQLLIPFHTKDVIRTQSDGPNSWRTYEHQHLMVGHQLGWINNETVLVVGSRKPEGEGIYAWNPGERPRMILKNGYRFCFDGHTWTALAGVPKKGGKGNEYTRYQINSVDLKISRLGAKPPATGFEAASYFTCNDKKLPKSLKGRDFEILRPSDGFLDLGPYHSSNQRVTLIKADTTTRQNTPILLKTPIFTSVEYSLYARAYLIYSTGFNPEAIEQWKASNQRNIWLMQPDGRTTTMTIPAGPWLDTGSGDKSLTISKPGPLISSKGLGEPRQRQAGVFLIREDRSHSKIASGSSGMLSVAPNGCRVAWEVNRPKASGIGSTTNISAADLCPPAAKAATPAPQR